MATRAQIARRLQKSVGGLTASTVAVAAAIGELIVLLVATL